MVPDVRRRSAIPSVQRLSGRSGDRGNERSIGYSSSFTSVSSPRKSSMAERTTGIGLGARARALPGDRRPSEPRAPPFPDRRRPAARLQHDRAAAARTPPGRPRPGASSGGGLLEGLLGGGPVDPEPQDQLVPVARRSTRPGSPAPPSGAAASRGSRGSASIGSSSGRRGGAGGDSGSGSTDTSERMRGPVGGRAARGAAAGARDRRGTRRGGAGQRRSSISRSRGSSASFRMSIWSTSPGSSTRRESSSASRASETARRRFSYGIAARQRGEPARGPLPRRLVRRRPRRAAAGGAGARRISFRTCRGSRPAVGQARQVRDRGRAALPGGDRRSTGPASSSRSTRARISAQRASSTCRRRACAAWSSSERASRRLPSAASARIARAPGVAAIFSALATFASCPAISADRQRAESEALAARDDRGRDLVQLGRGQDEPRVRRRLLESLQQGVEGLVGQHVDFVDDGDPEPVALRRVADRLDQLPGVLDLPVGGAVHLVDVERLAPLQDLAAGRAFAAGLHGRPLLAVQGPGEHPRRRGLPDAPGAGQQVGGRHAAFGDRVGESPGDGLLADQVVEGTRGRHFRGSESVHGNFRSESANARRPKMSSG